MLSPIATKLIIKHFDSIDKALSSRLHRTARPWDEPAINHLFVDLFDAAVQDDVKIDFTLAELQAALLSYNELASVQLKIDTHAYSSYMERYVTQSDIGVVIEYKDRAKPENDMRVCWLLQAKRAFPVTTNPLRYAPQSRFKSADPQQAKRIQELQKLVGTDFIKYLLYCPRAEHLDVEERRQLSYHRTRATVGHIFDYTLGLALRDDIMNGSPTLEAGVFIANTDEEPRDIAATHERMFYSTMPLSWFIVSHFGRTRWRALRNLFDDSNPVNPLVEMIVTGNEQAVREISNHFGEELDFQILPPVTITISVSDGYVMQQ